MPVLKIIIYDGIFFERIYLNNTGEIPHKKAITNAKYVEGVVYVY